MSLHIIYLYNIYIFCYFNISIGIIFMKFC